MAIEERVTGSRAGVTTRNALRLTANDLDMLAMAHEWIEREPLLGMFALRAGAVGRMETVAAIAALGLPLYRETNVLDDSSAENLDWVITKLIAPSGPFRYVSAVPTLHFLEALVASCERTKVALDSLVVRVNAETELTTPKLVKAFVTHMSDLGISQIRTDIATLRGVAEPFAAFDIWLDDYATPEPLNAAVVVCDATSSRWSHPTS